MFQIPAHIAMSHQLNLVTIMTLCHYFIISIFNYCMGAGPALAKLGWVSHPWLMVDSV